LGHVETKAFCESCVFIVVLYTEGGGSAVQRLDRGFPRALIHAHEHTEHGHTNHNTDTRRTGTRRQKGGKQKWDTNLHNIWHDLHHDLHIYMQASSHTSLHHHSKRVAYIFQNHLPLYLPYSNYWILSVSVACTKHCILLILKLTCLQTAPLVLVRTQVADFLVRISSLVLGMCDYGISDHTEVKKVKAFVGTGKM